MDEPNYQKTQYDTTILGFKLVFSSFEKKGKIQNGNLLNIYKKRFFAQYIYMVKDSLGNIVPLHIENEPGYNCRVQESKKRLFKSSINKSKEWLNGSGVDNGQRAWLFVINCRIKCSMDTLI